MTSSVPSPGAPTPPDGGRPFSLERALRFPAVEDTRQVVMTKLVWDAWVRSVYAAGLYVFPIPSDANDLPTYGVGAYR